MGPKQVNAAGNQKLERCVIVFGRYPRPGRVKTRLIPMLGALGAAELQRELTEKVIDTALGTGSTAVQFCGADADPRQMRRWLGRPGLELHPQCRGDLGRRMAAALTAALEQDYRQVLLVGTDLPDLCADHLRRAFQALGDRDLVLGPSTDGGYWLVGAKRPPAVFDQIPWGTDRVLAATLAAARTQGLSTALLEPLRDIDTPDDLKSWRPMGDWRKPYLSVILPVLNEAAGIAKAVAQVRKDHTQVIVVDGGSRDDTIRRAVAGGATVVGSPPGRALQQNRGASLAQGRVLLFVHADTRLPPDFDAQIFETLLNRRVVLGAFRFKTDWPGAAMGLIEKAAHLRATALQMPYGDQALFLSRALFEKIGGFPRVPIAEDLLLVRRLRRLGRIELAAGHAVTSARRWRSLGIVRTTLINYVIAGGALLGIDPALLAPLYNQRVKRKNDHESSQTQPFKT